MGVEAWRPLTPQEIHKLKQSMSSYNSRGSLDESFGKLEGMAREVSYDNGEAPVSVDAACAITHRGRDRRNITALRLMSRINPG